ncbi:hypothetical protein [Candidatus Protochlamydia phocaeensis]|uniref:hypothetical protein n=1 Tax=Candidatus Protochlamydia phocaeensis TaxID=1414722 RepID=UPI000838A76E|nr:hypothetical protein [Candidatus Protochlamydia phocaeensis]
MQILRKYVMVALFFALATHSVYGQPAYNQEYDYSDSAYTQGSRAAHWSVYVPIALFVAAGILFGIADKDHKGSHSHSGYDSYDGLGRLESYGSSSHSGGYSRSGYSH